MYCVLYEALGVLCVVATDPCADNNGGCQGTCENRDGGAVCGCPEGYQLGTDQKSCTGNVHHTQHTQGDQLGVCLS